MNMDILKFFFFLSLVLDYLNNCLYKDLGLDFLIEVSHFLFGSGSFYGKLLMTWYYGLK